MASNHTGNQLLTLVARRIGPATRLAYVMLCLAAAGHALTLLAGEVTLAWDPNQEADLAGYRLYYGPESGQYDQVVDVGNVTTFTVTNLPVGVPRYFVVTAYNTSDLESDFSNEVAHTIPMPPAARILARQVFYNDSAWDNRDPASNGQDDGAIDPGKRALLPGGKASFANYTSYSRGLNGLMIDIADLPGPPTISDFEFSVGNDNTPTEWTTAPAPSSVTVRPGAGVDGSDRITLIWQNNNRDATVEPHEAVGKAWLEVTVKATPNTGLAAADVFYFGNAVGEVGNSSIDAMVDTTDVFLPYYNQTPVGMAPITSRYDVNRDRTVDTTDVFLPYYNQTGLTTALRLLDLSSVSLSGLSSVVEAVELGGSPPLTEAAGDWVLDEPVTGVAGSETPPRLHAQRTEGGDLRITIAAPSDVWQLQWTEDLIRSPWRRLPAGAIQPLEQSGWQLALPVGDGAGFFRVIQVTAEGQ